MSVSITVSRAPADTVAPDIVDNLLTDETAAKERGRAFINHFCSSRKNISGNGPKNTLMLPTKLTEVIKKTTRYRGILTMYSRSYNRNDKEFTMDSAIQLEIKIPDTRPEV